MCEQYGTCRRLLQAGISGAGFTNVKALTLTFYYLTFCCLAMNSTGSLQNITYMNFSAFFLHFENVCDSKR